MCHAKYYALLEKKRFIAPIGENPQRILDLGCGTGKWLFALGVMHSKPDYLDPKLTCLTYFVGIWSIDVADMYPSADVCITKLCSQAV
jgi:SAM-dependent methyltransferase